MQIAVISDLHLGAGDRADTFGHDEHEFLRFLRYLEQNFERIVLLGGIWEALTGARYGDAAGALTRARAAHPEIADRFRTRQYHYVHGNHDIIAGLTERAPEELEWHVDGTRILFTHGHHHDVLIRKARWLSEFGGWILRLRMSPLYSAFSAPDALRSGHTADSNRCPFQRWATSLARLRGADVVVTGHTHQASRAEHGNNLFLTSGSCAEGKYSFLGMDTRRGDYGVHSTW